MKGIYKITNKKNKKSYIGQSIEIEKRWKWHINESQRTKSKEYNKSLYMAFRKYGIENFTFEILEQCQRKDLIERELYWYHFYKPNYNMVKPVEKIKSRQSQKVYKIDKKTLKIVKIYSSVREAGRQNKVSKTAILNVCNSSRNTVNDFYFCKEKDYKNFTVPIDKGNSGERRRKIVKIDPKTMEVIEEYESLAHAGKQNNCSVSQIRQRCVSKNFNSTINGGFYKFKEEYNYEKN